MPAQPISPPSHLLQSRHPHDPDAAWVAANFAESHAAPFSSDDLSELALYLSPVSAEWGEVLFQEGEHPAGVWILQAGAVEMSFSAGRQRAVIRMINPGEAVGDIQILRNVRSAFRARAAEPSALLFLARDDFLDLLAANRSISLRWMAKLALQVSRNHSRIVSLLTGSIEHRVAQFLLSEEIDGAFRHSQATIAAMLGVHRSSVNRVLREFEAAGLVKLDYRCVHVLEPAGLRRLGEGEPAPAI